MANSKAHLLSGYQHCWKDRCSSTCNSYPVHYPSFWKLPPHQNIDVNTVAPRKILGQVKHCRYIVTSCTRIFFLEPYVLFYQLTQLKVVEQWFSDFNWIILGQGLYINISNEFSAKDETVYSGPGPHWWKYQ